MVRDSGVFIGAEGAATSTAGAAEGCASCVHKQNPAPSKAP